MKKFLQLLLLTILTCVLTSCTDQKKIDEIQSNIITIVEHHDMPLEEIDFNSDLNCFFVDIDEEPDPKDFYDVYYFIKDIHEYAISMEYGISVYFPYAETYRCTTVDNKIALRNFDGLIWVDGECWPSYFVRKEYGVDISDLGWYDEYELCKDFYKLRTERRRKDYIWKDDKGKTLFVVAVDGNENVLWADDWRVYGGIKTYM